MEAGQRSAPTRLQTVLHGTLLALIAGWVLYIGKTIHPHPTLGESVGLAAEAYEGVCTDLPPVRKK